MKGGEDLKKNYRSSISKGIMIIPILAIALSKIKNGVRRLFAPFAICFLCIVSCSCIGALGDSS